MSKEISQVDSKVAMDVRWALGDQDRPAFRALCSELQRYAATEMAHPASQNAMKILITAMSSKPRLVVGYCCISGRTCFRTARADRQDRRGAPLPTNRRIPLDTRHAAPSGGGSAAARISAGEGMLVRAFIALFGGNGQASSVCRPACICRIEAQLDDRKKLVTKSSPPL
jgi:hypothetical protein